MNGDSTSDFGYYLQQQKLCTQNLRLPGLPVGICRACHFFSFLAFPLLRQED